MMLHNCNIFQIPKSGASKHWEDLFFIPFHKSQLINHEDFFLCTLYNFLQDKKKAFF